MTISPTKPTWLKSILFCCLTIVSHQACANEKNTVNNSVNNVDCIASTIPAVSTPQLYDAYPYKFLTKNWSVSESMDTHFNLQKSTLKTLQGQTIVKNPVNSIRFATAGDIMRMPSEQNEYVDTRLNQYLETFDVVVANLESVVTKSQPVPPDSVFMMNSDPSILTPFKRSDGSNIFSAVSFANNHTFDYPDEAIEDTLAYLKKINVPQSGIRNSEKPYVVIERKGIRVGYYSITTFVNIRKVYEESKMPFNPILEGIALVPSRQWTPTCELDYEPIKQVLAQMDNDNIDFKVISVHWGFEHDMYPVPQQLQIAREIMRQGWDVFVGSHPHSLQPAEVCFFNGYEKNLSNADALRTENQCLMDTADGIPRKSIAYYSLGNLTSYTPIFWQQVGAIAELDFVKDAEGKTDWHSPNYTYTYDHTFNPPHGKQFLTLFDKQGIECPWDNCVNELEQFLDQPKQHMEGTGFTLLEQWKVTWESSADTISAFLEWMSYKKEHPEEK